MLKFIKEQKPAVITALIGTIIFVYFLQPILEGLARIFLTLTSFVSEAYVDRIYIQAAQLETINYSYLLWLMVTGPIIGAMFAIGIRCLIPCGVLRKKLNITSANNSASYKSIIGILSITLGCLGLASAMAGFIQLRLITSFEQHMRILSPYVNEQQEKKLMSQWSLMSGHKDYENLYEILNKIANQNHISLPSNKIYSASSI